MNSSEEKFCEKIYQIINPNLSPKDGLGEKSYSFSTKLNFHLLVRYNNLDNSHILVSYTCRADFSAICWKCQNRKK